MIYRDKNNIEIKDGENILFSLEDIVEPSGYNKYATNVELCFWSEIEKRYIPFSEQYNQTFIKDCEKIKVECKKKVYL